MISSQTNPPQLLVLKAWMICHDAEPDQHDREDERDRQPGDERRRDGEDAAEMKMMPSARNQPQCSRMVSMAFSRITPAFDIGPSSRAFVCGGE